MLTSDSASGNVDKEKQGLQVCDREVLAAGDICLTSEAKRACGENRCLSRGKCARRHSKCRELGV